MKKIILGAGIAGLGAYYADNSVEIYEASDKPGGLCQGFWIDNFYFDQAVHFSFAKDKIVREVFDKTEQFYHHPYPSNRYMDRWLRHPIQNNLFALPIQYKINAIKGFVERKGRDKSVNFAEWLSGGYGDFLYENLFRIYNEKYWQTSLEKMGVDWIGNRLYMPSIDEVLYGAFTAETPNVYYASEMRYPKKGGYYSFISNIAEKAEKMGKLHLGKKVVNIDSKNKIVGFADNTKVEYDELFSSIPLPDMVKLMAHSDIDILQTSEKLEHTGVALVSIGLNCNKFKEFWFYIYDEDIMSARAHMPSVKSSNNAPEGCSSIQFEIYFSSKGKKPDKKSAIDNCIYALRKMGIAKEVNILFVDFRIMPYGNVTMLSSTEKDAESIKTWIVDQGITPIGRFGEWKYLWSDQAFMSGFLNCKGMGPR